MLLALVVLAVVLPALLALLHAVLVRPQRGVLLLAGLAPFDGLLLLVPHPAVLDGWKEGLLLLVLAGALLSREHRPLPRPPWWPALLALLLLALGSALAVGGVQAAVGLKVGFLWVLLVPVLLRCPLTARDRDRLLTVLMAAGTLTALVGLVQQVVGDQALVALGYEYDTAIRTSGGVLRSFSTFTQPFGFGLFVMVVLLVGVPSALADPARPRNRAFLLLTPVLVAGMLSSIVRAAVLGLGVGLVFLAVHRYRRLALLLLPGALAAVLAAVLVPASLWRPLLSGSSLAQRGTGWRGALDQVLGAPLGNGLGSSGSAAELTARITGSPLATYQPDNQHFKMLFELGPLGLWLFLLLLTGAFLHARWRSAQAGDPVDAALAAGTAAVVLACGAASLVATYLEIFPLDVLFWLLLGVLPSLHVRASSCTPSPSAPAAAASRPTAGSSSGP